MGWNKPEGIQGFIMATIIDSLTYRASTDVSQRWNDIDSRLELGFNESIGVAQTVQMVDTQGQVVAVGHPIEPNVIGGRS